MNDDTLVGLEVEVPGCAESAVDGLRSAGLKFQTHDDGSIRGRTFTVGGFAVIPQTSKRGNHILSLGMQPEPRPRGFGLEVAVDPYTLGEVRSTIAPLLANYFSDVPQSPLASIHIHVDGHNVPWRVHQRILKWVYHLEAVLFRLACGGQKHRGERRNGPQDNDYRFCRPLSNPIGIYNEDDQLQGLVDIKSLLCARSASEMLAHWGRLDVYWRNLVHYSPHRLMCVNLASLSRMGTIEWRLFDPMYECIPNMVNIVASIHKLAVDHEPDFAPMLLGQTPSIHGREVTCDWVSNILQMDVSDMWGHRWPRGCTTDHRESHYGRMTIQRHQNGGMYAIVSNGRAMDNGEDTFCLVCRV